MDGPASDKHPAAATSPAVLASVDGVISDAAEARIPLVDDGLLRGDGAFEIVRCYRGRPFTLALHLDRLERTCGTILLECPRTQLEAEIAALLPYAGGADCDLRIVVTRGGRHIVMLEPFPDWPPCSLALVTDSVRHLLRNTKTLSYAGNMLARRLAEQRGFTEALLVSPDGRVLENEASAFFWVTAEGTLCTPPLDEGILDSITRRIVMGAMPVEERECRVEDAVTATEAFLTGTRWELLPVHLIEEHVFEEVPGPVTRRALAAYGAAIAAELGFDPFA